MTVIETHNYKFICDICGRIETLGTDWLPKDWLVIADDCRIDVERTEYMEAYDMPPVRVLRDYWTNKAHIKAFVCDECREALFEFKEDANDQ